MMRTTETYESDGDAQDAAFTHYHLGVIPKQSSTIYLQDSQTEIKQLDDVASGLRMMIIIPTDPMDGIVGEGGDLH